MKLSYRPDIDGLRAIAVLLVLFQHIGLSLFSGGFIGVDIFFVISGFLITKILVNEIQDNTFKFGSFYKKRIVRLAPALFLVLFVTTIISFFIFLPYELLEYIESLMYSTFFLANVYMRQEAGDYFSPLVDEIPLLHLWSLGVEEQFYIFWPILLIFIFKYFKAKNFIYITFFMIIGSIFFAEYSMLKNPEKAYYKMPVRAFELLMGVILVFLPKIRISNRIAKFNIYLSLILLIFCSLYYGDQTKFPGLMASIPCFLTAIIIYFGQFYCNNFILTNSLSIWLGKISYPLYLWHWPIIAFLNFYMIKWTGLNQFLVILVTILLAFLTYNYIEKPSKRLLSQPVKKVILFGFFLPVIFFTIIASFTYLMKGFPNRFSLKLQAQEQALQMFAHKVRGVCEGGPSPEKLPPLNECILGVKKDTIDFLVLGDSHASAYTGMLDIWAKDVNYRGYDVTQGGTFYLPNVDLYETKNGITKKVEKFKVRNDLITQHLKGNYYNTIVLSGFYSLYLNENKELRSNTSSIAEDVFFEGFRHAIKNASLASEKVIVLLDVPELNSINSNCIVKAEILNLDLDCKFERNDIDIKNYTFRNFINEISKEYSNLNIVDPKIAFCNEKTCYSSLNGIPLYRSKDNNHLNYRGSEELGKVYLQNQINPLQ